MSDSLSTLFDEYLRECEFARKVKPETLRGYRQTFSNFIRVLPDVTCEQLTPATMTHFFQVLQQRKRVVGQKTVKVGVKKSTIATYWSKLNNFFEWLVRHRHIARNPFSSMNYPTPTYDDRKFLRKEDVERIIAAVHLHSGGTLLMRRNIVIFFILLYCGLRREELVSLQIRDVDLPRRILTVRAETSKIPRTRYIPLHPHLVTALKEYLRERRHLATPYLIVSSKQDRGLTQEGLKHLVAKMIEVSKVRFHLHQFRHTFAVNFLKSSNNVVKLKQLMGHRNITMTLVYLRCLPTSELKGDIDRMALETLI